ncbi:hypothetical protein [Paraglaciecola sp. L3A3]|uniref:hypothetical protein n=1 Tax=Paraglaciecola sp. L3A3 TaxID=2686358 RepID=UPI00131AED5C|nr:hypothetical protein [Paraglaciecola sp. L3A3]
MQDLIENLTQKLIHSQNGTQNYNIFIAEKGDTFRLINSQWNKSSYTQDLSFATVKKLDRGIILTIFAKLEFLINNCILQDLFSKPDEYNVNIKYFENISKVKTKIIEKFKSSTPIKSSHLLSEIQKIKFRNRLDYCLYLGMFGNEQKSKISDLINTRNYLAHEWAEKLAVYKDYKLRDPDNLKQFSKDLIEIFSFFIEKYRALQLSVNYRSLITEFLNE